MWERLKFKLLINKNPAMVTFCFHCVENNGIILLLTSQVPRKKISHMSFKTGEYIINFR